MGLRGPMLRRSTDPISALTGCHAPARGAGRTAHAPGSPTPPLGPLGPQERAGDRRGARRAPRLQGLRGFFSCFYRALLTHYTLSGEREYTTHTNTTPQHAASQACLLHDGDVFRVLPACFCCLPLGVGSKASGWKRGRQGEGSRGPARRGDRWARPLRAARVRTTAKQL